MIAIKLNELIKKHLFLSAILILFALIIIILSIQVLDNVILRKYRYEHATLIKNELEYHFKTRKHVTFDLKPPSYFAPYTEIIIYPNYRVSITKYFCKNKATQKLGVFMDNFSKNNIQCEDGNSILKSSFLCKPDNINDGAILIFCRGKYFVVVEGSYSKDEELYNTLKEIAIVIERTFKDKLNVKDHTCPK